MNTRAQTMAVGRKGILTLGMALALVAALGLTNEARAEGFLVIGGSTHGYRHGGYMTSGYYETRHQTVMVAPAHTQRQWVAPQYQTVYDRFGRPSTILVRAGYWTEVYVFPYYRSLLLSLHLELSQISYYSLRDCR